MRTKQALLLACLMQATQILAHKSLDDEEKELAAAAKAAEATESTQGLADDQM